MVRIDTTNMDLKINIVMDKFAEILQAEMIRRCPKEYGYMAASIDTKKISKFDLKTKGEIEVGTNDIPYAVWVEYGTGQMRKAHGIHVPWAPVRDWEALRKRGELKVMGGETFDIGQTMPFARSADFFTKDERMGVLKEAFHR